MEDFERCLLVKSEVTSLYAAKHKIDVSLYVIFLIDSFYEFFEFRSNDDILRLF